MKGLFTALITPFDSRGRVDEDRLANLVRFQLSGGTEGIYPCGSTGLGPMLSIEERKSVARTVIESTQRKVPVVVQVGCADTASTVKLARHAEDMGADAVASLTPFYYKPGDRATSKHFEALSKALGIPLFAYNIPQFTGNNLLAPIASKLARAGIISGIKDSSRDFLQLLTILEAVPDDFVVMNGTEEYGLFAIMSGADGLVSGGASPLPELFESMVSAQRRGDVRAALTAQKVVQQVRDLVKTAPIPAYYEILRLRGVDCGSPRRPFLPMGRSDTARTLKGLRRLGLI